MINGLYLATPGMNVEQKRMDILSNNLANINSTGFKKEKVVFEVYKDRTFLHLLKNQEIGNITGGVVIGQTLLDMSEGSLKQTGNPMDFAVSGMSLFVIDTPDGIRYTKNGAFKIDEDGYLTTQEGYYVQGSVGNILLNDVDSFYVDESGDIYADDNLLDSLNIVSVEEGNHLLMVGNSYFVLREGADFAEDVPVNVMQGYLEGSNVNGIAEMVDMIAITRAYEANLRVIKMSDEVLAKTVNQVGKIV